jgi:hypothetical protein
MTITRADILYYLQDALSDLAEETGQGQEDSPTGYKLPIDAALRRLGNVDPTAPTSPDTLTEAAYALAEYNALRRFWTMSAQRVDTITGPNFATTRSQLFANIEKLLKEAADRCALLGYPVIVGDQGGASSTLARSMSVPVHASW